MTNSELSDLIDEATSEIVRRQNSSSVETRIGEILDDAEKSGAIVRHEDGSDWQEPTGYNNAYRKDVEVVHNGKTWTSNIDGNMLEPGVSGWTEKVSEDPETGEKQYPVWTKPKGYQDAKKKGEIFRYPDEDGDLYESLRDQNSWSPDEAPDAWKKTKETSWNET